MFSFNLRWNSGHCVIGFCLRDKSIHLLHNLFGFYSNHQASLRFGDSISQCACFSHANFLHSLLFGIFDSGRNDLASSCCQIVCLLAYLLVAYYQIRYSVKSGPMSHVKKIKFFLSWGLFIFIYFPFLKQYLNKKCLSQAFYLAEFLRQSTSGQWLQQSGCTWRSWVRLPSDAGPFFSFFLSSFFLKYR